MGGMTFERSGRASAVRAALSGLAGRWPAIGALVPALVLAGCFGTQIFPTLQERGISLRAGDLEASGIAFVTPSAATGQEEEKQAVALVFADVLKRERAGVRVVPLAEALSAINTAGLADDYKRMYEDYRDTGLFRRELLARVAAATGARYIAQIKLQGFGQGAKERFGALGLRIVETKFASVRLFFQVWDSRDGTIAWEAMQEMHYSRDTVTEEQVSLRTVIGHTARELVAKLP